MNRFPLKAMVAGSCLALVTLTACSDDKEVSAAADTTAVKPAATTTAPAADKTMPTDEGKADTSADAADTSSGDAAGLDTDIKKISYSFGQMLGRRMSVQMQDLDMDTFLTGVQDAYAEKPSQIDDAEMNQLMQQYQISQQENAQKEFTEMAEKNLAAGNEFLADNKDKDGVKTTESGLQYKVEKEGEGESPDVEDTVEVHYTGKLLNGEVFDSSVERGETAVFPLAGVIPGWVEGLQLMKPGAKYELFIPAELAYGPQGNGRIGPNETLIFDVELIGVEETPAQGEPGAMSEPELSEPDEAPQPQSSEMETEDSAN